MFESPNEELIPKRFHQFIHQNMERNSRTEIGWAVISSRAFVPVQITSALWLQRQRRVVEKLCMTVWWMFPADTRRWMNFGYTLVQRRRRWSNVKPTFIQRLVSAGFVRRNPCCQQGRIQYCGQDQTQVCRTNLWLIFNPLTAGVAYIRVFIFY